MRSSIAFRRQCGRPSRRFFSTIMGNGVELRNFMDSLTATTNVSKYVELPMIAVMGDTSSGKSSLLSGISLVELPSNSNLTTRCPIMLKMNKSLIKHATVSVQWRQRPQGSTEDDDKFDEIVIPESEWATLTDAIETAQKHIIQCTGKEVARDVVHVNVHAPDCHDLTLIDLPGIVRSRGESEGASIVEDINALMEDYLENKRCVILAVVPANVDFHNSEIMAHAKKVDPETRRTIPVITKPDLIDAGGENEVLSLLLGEKIKFDLGFHMVKGRGQKMLDSKTSIEDGLLAENSFFDNTKPWRNVANRDIFGIPNLRTKLANLQMNMIRDTLPDIVNDMRCKKMNAEIELERMGQVLDNPADRIQYFRHHIHLFLTHLNASLSGSHFKGTDMPASARLHEAAGKFQALISKGRLANVSKISKDSEVLVRQSDGKEGAGTVLSVSVEEGCPPLFLVKTKNDSMEREYDFGRIRLDPKWLIKLIALKRTRTLPCFLNEDVFCAVAKQMMDDDCIPHCRNLLSRAAGILEVAIQDSINASGLSRRYPRLGMMVMERAKREASNIVDQERSRLQQYLEDELDPYTQNHYFFENIAKRRNGTLKEELLLALERSKEQNTEGDRGHRRESSSSTVDYAEAKSVIASIFEQNEKKSVDQHMAEEMEAVLDSYGKVAMKRIVDMVPMGCRRIFRLAPDVLRSSFDEITEAELASVIYHDSGFRERHDELTLQQKELERGLELFTSIM